MTRRPDSTLRSAFTLIELLVVISIIGLLIALLLPAVQRIRISAKRTQTGAEVSQLSAAASSFHQEFKFYPPEYFDGSTPAGLDVLNQMYPRWNRTGYTPPPGGALVGIQCLIYFICGPNMTGWAIDGPFAPTPSATAKKGPFFDYSGLPINNAIERYTLKDPFGTPYAYFASGKGGKYNTASVFTYTNPEGSTTNVRAYYAIGSGDKFVNSDSVQIISAGADGQRKNGGFGPGGLMGSVSAWAPETSPYSGGQPGADDLANFHGGTQLGSKQ